MLSYSFISCQHTLLYYGLTEAACTFAQSHSPPLAIKLNLDFRHFKIDGSPIVAITIHGIANHLQSFQHWQNILIVSAKSFIPINQYLVHQTVGQSPVYMDYYRQNLVFGYLSLRTYLHLASHSQPVYTSIQTANAIRKLSRQHWNDSIY